MHGPLIQIVPHLLEDDQGAPYPELDLPALYAWLEARLWLVHELAQLRVEVQDYAIPLPWVHATVSAWYGSTVVFDTPTGAVRVAGVVVSLSAGSSPARELELAPVEVLPERFNAIRVHCENGEQFSAWGFEPVRPGVYRCTVLPEKAERLVRPHELVDRPLVYSQPSVELRNPLGTLAPEEPPPVSDGLVVANLSHEVDALRRAWAEAGATDPIVPIDSLGMPSKGAGDVVSGLVGEALARLREAGAQGVTAASLKRSMQAVLDGVGGPRIREVKLNAQGNGYQIAWEIPSGLVSLVDLMRSRMVPVDQDMTEAERVELHAGLVASGLSDYEARATAWPEPPARQIVTEDPVFWDKLDPGIVDVVRLLRDGGFNTTDSGDGVSKATDPAYAAHPDSFTLEPHVVVRAQRGALERTADDMREWLADHGVMVDQLRPADDGESWGPAIQASYDPANGIGVVIVSGITGAMVRAAVTPKVKVRVVIVDDEHDGDELVLAARGWSTVEENLAAEAQVRAEQAGHPAPPAVWVSELTLYGVAGCEAQPDGVLDALEQLVELAMEGTVFDRIEVTPPGSEAPVAIYLEPKVTLVHALHADKTRRLVLSFRERTGPIGPAEVDRG